MNKSYFKYQSCNRCLMDTTTSKIVFNENGFCNFCTDFIVRQKNTEKTVSDLDKLISEIKSDGKNKKYDCIVGVSGGVDSCFALIRAVECGLRPLAVHMDNGWNSELAQNNISNLIRSLNVDLHTHVINWQEYKNLQEAFLKANVIDIELLYDNAMAAVNYKLANKFNIKYILSGMNTSTEGFKIPDDWVWFKNDARNIKKITKKFSNQKIKTFPLFGTFDFIYYEIVKKIKWILFPDYFDYKKDVAVKELEEKSNFKKYPYKHYDNVFTRFYQGYILPKKFGVDKRKLHLSNLIISNQMDKNEALRIMQKPVYENLEDEKKDKEYFLKKMKWSEKELENYLFEKEVSHSFYGSERELWNSLHKIYINLKKIKKLFG